MTDAIQEMIDRESRAFEAGDVDLMLSVYHPDMVWAWPPHSRAYDPMDWVLRMGRFDRERWGRLLDLFFETHELIHNRRVTRRIVMSEEGDGAFAVVDIDTLHRRRDADGESPWHDGTSELHTLGRACKIYTLTSDGWKMLYQPGTMHYPVGT